MSNQKIISLFEGCWELTDSDHIDTIFEEDGGIDPLEGVLLYLLCIKNNPEFIIEFSPHHGYSTMCIGLALKQIDRKASFVTCDINWKVRKPLLDRLEKHGIHPEYVTVLFGDALEVIPRVLQEEYRENKREARLCFIDSDHTEQFAQKYINKIFPLLHKSCIIGVHDICSTKLDNSGVARFKTSLLGGKFNPGEELAIRKYLVQEQHNWFSLHALSGGRHENANLPYNNEFYDKIKTITGIDFRSNKICPKTLWINL